MGGAPVVVSSTRTRGRTPCCASAAVYGQGHGRFAHSSGICGGESAVWNSVLCTVIAKVGTDIAVSARVRS